MRLGEDSPTMATDYRPIEEFDRWYQEGCTTQLRYPNAMSLATVDAEGLPSVRIVLMKHFDEQGLVFYTNLTSKKSKDLMATGVAAVSLHWDALGKQIRVSGAVEPVSAAEADEYFATRPRDSQIGAWASKQSESMGERSEFEARLARFTKEFEEKAVPRPEFWSGWRIVPQRIEFWLEQPYRLHERWVYTRKGQQWEKQLLYP